MKLIKYFLMFIGAICVFYVMIVLFDLDEEDEPSNGKICAENSYNYDDSDCSDECAEYQECENEETEAYSPNENEDEYVENSAVDESDVDDMKISAASDFYATASTDDESVSTDDIVIELTETQFKQQVADFSGKKNKYIGKKPCVVDFYAEWCGPCKQLSPIYEKVAKQYAGKVIFYRVDIEKASSLVSAYNIESIPTLMFCNEGIEMISGLPEESDLKQKVASIL